jgi:hypothetical protein
MMASAPNECWARDFVVDQLFDGPKLRVLTIVAWRLPSVSDFCSATAGLTRDRAG